MSAQTENTQGHSNTVALTILTPERKLIDKVQVEEVTLTTSEGQIQILPGHAPMIGQLETGGFSYKEAGKDMVHGAISTGFFELGDRLVVMAETLELQSEIDLQRAIKAQQGAEEALKDGSMESDKFRKYQLKLQRALIRQQIARTGRVE